MVASEWVCLSVSKCSCSSVDRVVGVDPSLHGLSACPCV